MVEPKNNPAPGSTNTKQPEPKKEKPPETGGPGGLEPTRYGDWERNGRVSDF